MGKSGSRPRSSIASRARSAKSLVSIASLGGASIRGEQRGQELARAGVAAFEVIIVGPPEHDYRGSALDGQTCGSASLADSISPRSVRGVVLTEKTIASLIAHQRSRRLDL